MEENQIRILLVEDNRGDQSLFQEALKQGEINAELSVLDRADQIVIFVEKLKPHIIFMDIMLSGITGGEAVKLLRHNIHTINIPVVFLTGIYGLGEELKEDKGINIEGQIYPAIAKPIETQRLMAIVKKCLS